MKSKILCLLVLILLSTVSAPAAEDTHGDFIYTSGMNLMLHGKSFRYVGTNTYYLMVYSVSPTTRKHVDEVFDSAGKMGLKVMRTWAFNDGKRQWNALQTAPGEYKEDAFVGLDRVIAKAKERNIYLILTLVNNMNDYGGAKQYVDWSPTALMKEHNEFFTDANVRQYYKDHIKAILTRVNTITGLEYRNDPAIMAWQLMNEPRVDNDLSGDILNNWIREMSDYVKTIDKNHLLMVGEEGFYANRNKYDWMMNGSRGQDFVRDHSLPSVDIASFHLWPSSDKYNFDHEQIADWIKIHHEDAVKIGKPLILDEYGEYRGYNGDTIERDKVYGIVIDALERYKVAGSNFWLLIDNGYKQYDDGDAVYYPEDKSTIEILESAVKKL